MVIGDIKRNLGSIKKWLETKGLACYVEPIQRNCAGLTLTGSDAWWGALTLNGTGTKPVGQGVVEWTMWFQERML